MYMYVSFSVSLPVFLLFSFLSCVQIILTSFYPSSSTPFLPSSSPPPSPCRHAQALGTLQAYTHWLSQLYLTTTRQHRTEDTVAQLVGTMVESATPLIAGDVPEKVVLAACQLLLSLASTVRPKFLTSFTCIQRLMEKATSGQLASLPARVRCGCVEVFV